MKMFFRDTLSKSRVFECYKIFKEGKESVEDETRFDRSFISTDE